MLDQSRADEIYNLGVFLEKKRVKHLPDYKLFPIFPLSSFFLAS